GQDGLVEAEDFEAEVGADHEAGGAPGAAGMELGVVVAKVVDLGSHRQHARRARSDAQLAALARVDVDGDGAPALARRHGRARSCSQAGKARWSTASKPARIAVSFAAMCCRR